MLGVGFAAAFDQGDGQMLLAHGYGLVLSSPKGWRRSRSALSLKTSYLTAAPIQTDHYEEDQMSS
jgi:hypothetical protein